jgi:hypothetical protein
MSGSTRQLLAPSIQKQPLFKSLKPFYGSILFVPNFDLQIDKEA